MAEDLSIKVKVEPDGGGVQGKLDEIAKNKKFNVQIDPKSLEKQLTKISKTVASTLQNSMEKVRKEMDSYAESAQQAAIVIRQAQEREKAALITNVNLLAQSAQERKNAVDAINKQTSAQKNLNDQTQLTSTQKGKIDNSAIIKNLNRERDAYVELSTAVSDFNKVISSSEGVNNNTAANSIKSLKPVQKDIAAIVTDISFSAESEDDIKNSVLSGFNAIEEGLNEGSEKVKTVIDNIQNSSKSSIKSILDLYSEVISAGDNGLLAQYIANDENATKEAIAEIVTKYGKIAEVSTHDVETTTDKAFDKISEAFNGLKDKLAATAKEVISADTEEATKKAAVKYLALFAQMANVIGALPDNVRKKAIENVDSVTEDIGKEIEQKTKELSQKYDEVAEQPDNKVKLNVDLDDEQIDTRVKETSSYIVEQLNKMKDAQLEITVAKQGTLEAEKAIVKATQDSINALKTLVKQKEQIADEISKLKSEVTGITDGKDKADDAKTLLETLSAINPSKVKDVLDKVSAFVNSVAESNPKLETTKTKAAEFNAAIESINKTLAISTAFLTSLTKEDKTAKGKRGGKKTQKADTTEVDEAVKLQQLVLNAEKAADAVKNAITNASNSINTITTELKTAATSADGAKEATRPMIEAATALNNTFKQYSESLADIKTNAGLMNGTVTKAKRGKKATAETASMDDVAASVTKANEASTQIHTVFTKFAKIGAATNGFAEKAAQIIAASDEVNAIILAYKTTGERTATTTADAAKQQQSAAQELSAQMETVGATLNNAGEKVGRATTALSEAAQASGTIDASVKTLVNAGNRLKRLFTSYANIAAGLQENLDKVAEIDGSKNATTYRKLGNFINNIVDFYKKSIGELSAINSVKLPKDENGKTVTPKVDAAVTEATQRFKATLDEALSQALATLKDTSGLDAKLAKAQKSTTDAEKAKTDIVNGFAEITAVFNNLTNAAKSITDSMTDLAKLKTMTDEVNMDQFAELINNSVDEQIKKISTKIRKDAMLQTSPDNSHVTSLAMKTGNLGAMIKQMPEGVVKDSYTKQFAELNDDITAFYNGSEKAATTWADIVSRTTEMAEGVKQVNKETQEAVKAAAQSAIKSAQDLEQRQALATELQQRFDALNNTIAKGKEIEGNGKAFNEFHSALEQIEVDAKRLGPQLESALDKKDIVSLKALTDYDKNLTDIEQRVAKVTDGVISTTSKAVKSVADQKEELKNIDPTAAINKALNLNVDGAESAKITRLRKELEESKTTIANARKAYEDDWSSDNFDKLVTAMKNGQDAANKFTTAVKTANDTMADNGTRSNERQFEQIKDFLANYQTMLTTLQRSAGNKGFKELGGDNGVYKQTKGALESMAKKAEQVKSAADVPTFIAAMAKQFENAKTPIESVSDALNAVKTKIGETKAEADKFNGALKSQRDVNTYIKSVSNSLYTAQRYLSNNSKITTDPAIYARYLEYIERYQELLKSGKITQQNGQEYASEASKEFAELKKAVQDAGLETDTLAMKFKKLFETNIKSQFASQVINMVEQGLRQIYQNVVNIDSAMTELKKVTNETDNTYDAFLDDAGTRAKNLGASISDIVTASADFARLGYNLKDSKELADAAVLYQHVGDGISSVNDASESIISTMKAFGVEAKDVTSIVDKFNEVGNNYAISSAGVGSALQRSASALHTAGNTLDQSIGMIVAANDVAQDPESVGNALKVLSLRIRGAKTDLEQMGESTDDVAVSTSKLREQIKALTNVDGKGGFDILTKSGDFKSTYEIMEGIANVWKEMNDVDKASLLEQVAGKNRANVVSGMLDNWKDAQNAAKTAAESAGSATKENETYLDSINGKISQFTAAFEKLSKDVLDSDLIKFFIELATHIANLADEAVKLVDNIGLIPTAIGGIGAALGVSLIKNKGTSGKLYARLHKGNSCVGCRCQIIKYPNCWERLRAA
jgi:TP901 family phage tail tape measure protein